MLTEKKIGILTLHWSNNYGAMLQVYALSQFLGRRGFDVFVVNYHPEAPSASDYLKRPFAFLGKVIGKGAFTVRFLRGKLTERKGYVLEEDFSKVFEEFRTKNLNITHEAYDFRKLVAAPPEACAFITGSDQVWASDFVFSSPAYLLSFAPKGTRRISYAASFGKAALEPYLRRTFRKHLAEFDSISVRESSGVDLVRNLTGLEVFKVVDPTLLLTDYSEIIDYSLVPDHDFILAYRLGQEIDLTRWMDRSLEAISKAMKLPIYSVSTNSAKGWIHVGESLRPTPGQLLGLIERSKFFVTNSFHGTVFAVLLKAKFLTFARDSAVDKQNIRLTELLTLVGLDKFFCGPGTEVEDILSKIDAERDFDAAHKLLERHRANSIEFLNKALD